jgi:phage/plasmid-associated DNA primase
MVLDTIGVILSHTKQSTTILFVATLDQLLGTEVVLRFINAGALFKNVNIAQNRRNELEISLSYIEHMAPEDFTEPDCYLRRMSPQNYKKYFIDLRNSLRQSYLAYMSIMRIHKPTEDVITQDIRTISWIYEPPKIEELETLSPHQKLLEFMYVQCRKLLLRRANTSVYRQKYTLDNRPTYFFEQYKEALDFIYETVVPQSTNFDMYNAVTAKRDTAEHVTKLLLSLPDPRLPKFESDRCLFSFQNGIFDVRNCQFYSYTTNTIPGIHSVDDLNDVCTSNYFDTTIPTGHITGSVEDILTPCFDKILLDQRYGTKDIYWFQAMLGRTLHDIGTMDDWQVSLYVRGVAGSGKSTVLRLWSEVYPKHQVGFLADDSETTFTDQHLVDARMVCCLDVSKEFRMATTRFNSYVCGENVVINRKYKTALTVSWKAQLIFASNDNPPIKSRAGSGGRRFIIFLFDEPVNNSDPLLMAKCRKELPFFMIKCARKYLDAYTKFKGQSVWDNNILPVQCHKAREEYVCTMSPIAAFFTSGLLEAGDTYIMTLATLRSTYHEYLQKKSGATLKDQALDRMELAVELKRLRCVLHEEGPYKVEKYPDLRVRFDIMNLDLVLPIGQHLKERIYGLRLHIE